MITVTPADLTKYPLGSILAGGNAAPGWDIHATGAQWLELTDAFFRASTKNRSAAHPPIPVLFGIDAVHGHAKVRGATIFPHNVGLGAAHDPALIEKIGRATAEEVAATGIDWTFAPTVAVVRDVRWGVPTKATPRIPTSSPHTRVRWSPDTGQDRHSGLPGPAAYPGVGQTFPR